MTFPTLLPTPNRRTVLAGSLAVSAVSLLPPLSVRASEGKVFHRGNQSEPSSLDPHLGTDIQSSRIGVDLFEGLLTYGNDGTIIPGVAERWEISADGLTYTFHLRGDSRWSDGTPVTARDFVIAWRRLVEPKTGSQYAYFLWPLKHGQAITEGKQPLERLGVEAVDDRTLKVVLEKPTGYFLSSLVHRMTYPISAASYEKLGNDFAKPGNLVSNGAYVFVGHVPQSYAKLVKNPHFREADQIKIDTVYFHHIESPETELRRFRAGELDIVQQAPVTQIDWLDKNMPEAKFFYPVMNTRYLPINMERGSLKDHPKLRQALYLAVDRQAMVEKITKTSDLPAWTFSPPNIPGYTPPVPETAKLTQAERNELARKLAAEEGFGPGGKPIEVEIIHSTSENIRRTMVGVAAMWQQALGAKVILNNQEWKVVLQKLAEKDYAGAGELGWIADFPDAYNFLKIQRADVGRMNRTGYANPTYDAMLDEANLLVDPQTRAAKLAEAEALMMADMPLIPIYHQTYRNLVAPRVKGWFANPLGQQPTRYIDIQS